MKYLCLVYGDEDQLAAVDDRECRAVGAELRASGQCLAAEALESVSTATTLRIRAGRLSISDGPFAETREVLAGFYLIEARDLNDAIHLAAKIPSVQVGGVEVRPVRTLRGPPRDDVGNGGRG